MALDSTKFETCLKLATEAKKLRDDVQELLLQAQSIEEKAIESFRKVREEMLNALQHEKEELVAELNDLNTEYFELAHTFCEQNGSHTNTYRTVITSNIPIGRNFYGNIYPTERHSTCLICGMTNDSRLLFRSRRFYQEGSDDVIQKASEQTENLELKKTAQRILEIRKQFKSLEDKLNENSKGFEEICSVFGHDAEMTSRDRKDFKCKCCGKEMGYEEYIDAHYAARYKGGIVPFHYVDNQPIL